MNAPGGRRRDLAAASLGPVPLSGVGPTMQTSPSDQLRAPGLAWADAVIAVGPDPAGVGQVPALTGPRDGPDVGVL
jgi:hypothetical protein